MGEPTLSIGIVGIGQIGLPVAVNLMRAGYRVSGFRRTGREAFVQAGGVALESPAEVTRQCDVLLLCLPGEQAQEAVLNGASGVLCALSQGQLVIDLGTYSQAYKQELERRLDAVGARFLEAEVSGSPPMVADRRASLYVGGDEVLFETVKPLLDAITQHHFHLGPIGAAVNMKLIANTLLTIHTLAAAEAMNLGARSGLDPRKVAEVIRHGAGNSTMFTIRAPMMADRKFSPAPGPFTTLQKYLEMADEMAKSSGSSMPLFSVAAPYFLRAIKEGIGNEDISAVIKLLESESGRGSGPQG